MDCFLPKRETPSPGFALPELPRLAQLYAASEPDLPTSAAILHNINLAVEYA
jgi:hypothetical protein